VLSTKGTGVHRVDARADFRSKSEFVEDPI